jgi:hypothetical protein
MSTDTVHGCCTLNEYFMSFSARTFLSSTSIYQLCAPRTLNSSYVSTTILILLYFLQVTSSLSFPFQLPSFSFYLYHYHNLSSLPKNNIVNIIYKSQFIKTNNSFMFSSPLFFLFLSFSFLFLSPFFLSLATTPPLVLSLLPSMQASWAAGEPVAVATQIASPPIITAREHNTDQMQLEIDM